MEKMAEFEILKRGNTKLYLYTTPTSVESVMSLVNHICETSRVKIYVVGGCHGDVSGQNWNFCRKMNILPVTAHQ